MAICTMNLSHTQIYIFSTEADNVDPTRKEGENRTVLLLNPLVGKEQNFFFQLRFWQTFAYIRTLLAFELNPMSLFKLYWNYQSLDATNSSCYRRNA